VRRDKLEHTDVKMSLVFCVPGKRRFKRGLLTVANTHTILLPSQEATVRGLSLRGEEKRTMDTGRDNRISKRLPIHRAGSL
jgi:hypothetical protein